jgi:hypothetical protein
MKLIYQLAKAVWLINGEAKRKKIISNGNVIMAKENENWRRRRRAGYEEEEMSAKMAK